MDQATLPQFMARQASFAGYKDQPAVCGSMTFLLPPFKLATSRLVRVDDRLWEAWSPNSDRTAFYPGVPDSRFSLATPDDAARRRADGHLGRFDPTRNPQLLAHDKLWYPFVRPDCDANLALHPEYTKFHDVWNSREQALAPEFLSHISERMKTILKSAELHTGLAATHPSIWRDRPAKLDLSLLEALRTADRYDAALDLYSRLQRQAKLTSAWSKMAQALVDRPPTTVFSNTPVRVANPGWMGAWINGATQEDAMWLLRLGIPCYIVHEVETYRERQAFANKSFLPSFAVLTAVHEGVRNKPAADLTMENLGWTLSLSDPDEWISKRIPPSTWLERGHSSSAGQGWRDGQYASPPEILSPFEEVNGHILPPPVIGTGSRAGKWTLWLQDQVEDYGLCFVRQASTRRSNNVEGTCYYDREKRRCLVLDDAAVPPFSYTAPIEKFGLPAPDVPYLSKRAQRDTSVYQREPMTTWMYVNKEAAPLDIGSIFEEVVIPPDDEQGQEGDMDVDNPRQEQEEDTVDYPRPPPSPSIASSPRRSGSRSSSRSPLPSPAVSAPDFRAEISSRPYSPPARYYQARDRSRSPVRGRVPMGRELSPMRSSPYRRALPPVARRPPPSFSRRDRSPVRARSPPPPRRFPSPYRRSRSPLPRRAWSPPPRRFASPPRYRQRPPSPSPPRRIAQLPPPGPSRRPFVARLSSPPARSLMDRLSTAAASTSTALVQRDPSQVVPARPRALRLPPNLPILRFVGVESRILAITDLPDYFVWVDVLGWLRTSLNRAGRTSILRVLRSVEPDGRQVFWLKMATIRDAAALRGVMSQRIVNDSPELRVHFVHPNLYSARASAFYDAWSPLHGMEIANRPGIPVSIWDRLALPRPDMRPASLPPPIDPPANFLRDAPEPEPDADVPLEDLRPRHRGGRRR